MPLKSLIKSVVVAAAVTIAGAPLIASHADAGGRKKSNGMMRLGGPSQNGQMMRLGGPTEARSSDRGIYALPNRLVSNRPEDVREYFLRRDQQGSGN